MNTGQSSIIFAKETRFSDVIRLSRHWFLLFCVFHLVFWSLLPSILYQNLPYDTLDTIAWGQQWALGYPEHPFLTPWIAAFVNMIFPGADWPMYCMAQISIILCFWGVWRLANKIVSPWQALVAVVLLDGINYYNISAAIFTPNVLMLPLWSLLALNFYNALREQKIWQWLLVGLFAGLAMLTKYESALLLVLMLGITLVTIPGRQSWRKPGIYLGLLLSLLLFLPNLYYLYQHDFNAVTYALREMKTGTNGKVTAVHPFYFHASLIFLLQQIVGLLPVLMLLAPFYRAKNIINRLSSNFDWYFITILAFGPLLLTMLISIVSHSYLVSRWGFPFFCFLGIFLVLWLNPKMEKPALTWFAGIWLVLTIVTATSVFFIAVCLPYINHQANSSRYFPGRNIAASVTERWHQLYHRRLAYVIGNARVTSSVAVYSQDNPVPFVGADLQRSPWVNEKLLQQHGAALAYNISNLKSDDNFIAMVKKRYPGITNESIESFYPQTHAKVVTRVKIWMAFLPPAQTQEKTKHPARG